MKDASKIRLKAFIEENLKPDNKGVALGVLWLTGSVLACLATTNSAKSADFLCTYGEVSPGTRADLIYKPQEMDRLSKGSNIKTTSRIQYRSESAVIFNQCEGCEMEGFVKCSKDKFVSLSNPTGSLRFFIYEPRGKGYVTIYTEKDKGVKVNTEACLTVDVVGDNDLPDITRAFKDICKGTTK